MDELITRIATSAGIEPGIARKSAGMIFSFLRNEGPKDEVDALFAAVPGSAEAADAAAGEDAGGAFAGAMGGGLMGLAGRLTGLGFGMGEMQTIGRQVFAYMREKAGDERVGQIVSAIPGLGQFL
jgi:predicted lipid-binding transport protein (Tim44 family)